ncbi:MAG: response regulator [Candidatus Colwellbacteria bacterium]|nr:response regulator [Candidatus Colwellbacteria bacterium]
MKILIVEDEEALSRVLKEKFETEGFESMIVGNGADAVETTAKFKPDVVVLDLLLPKKDGFTILGELKADAELKAIPVVVLSNLGEDENIKRAIQLGAADYFVKTQHPINEIIEKVKEQTAKGI